jgi:N-acetylmuramoyl-L-alanine amidase
LKTHRFQNTHLFLLVLVTVLILYALPYSAQQKDNQQMKISVQSRISTYLDKDNKLGGFYAISDEGFSVYANPEKKGKQEAEYFIPWTALDTFQKMVHSGATTDQIRQLGKVRHPSTPRPAISIHLRPPAPKTNPFEGMRIALDPGHSAGSLENGEIEQKYIHILKDSLHHIEADIGLTEGHLTLCTALFLKKILVQNGALVFMTHEKPDETAFGETFAEWRKTALPQALDSLVASMTKKKAQEYSSKAKNRKVFMDVFRDIELKKRAELINAFHPDLTVIVHYNVNEKNTDWKKLTDKDYVMAFMGGGMLPSDLNKPEKRFEFLRLALTEDLNKSEQLASCVVKSFNDILQVPIAKNTDATYLLENCKTTSSPGVFCRNLILTRIIHSPLVYGETLYQDNRREAFLLSDEQEEINGLKTSARVRQVAESYYKGLFNYLQLPPS